MYLRIKFVQNVLKIIALIIFFRVEQFQKLYNVTLKYPLYELRSDKHFRALDVSRVIQY